MRISTCTLWFISLILYAVTACSPAPATPPLTQAIYKETASPPPKIPWEGEPQEPLPLTTFGMPPRPVTALTLIQQAETKAQQLDSSQFKQTILVKTDGFLQQIEQHCQVAFPDKMHCQTAVKLTMEDTVVAEKTTEVVQHGQRIWLREGEAETWNELVQKTAVSNDFLLKRAVLSDYMQQPSLAGEVDLAGESMQKIHFGLNVQDYVESILPKETAVIFSAALHESSGDGTLWIGQESSLTQQAIISLTLQIGGQPLNITTEATYFGFDLPVSIPNPSLSHPDPSIETRGLSAVVFN